MQHIDIHPYTPGKICVDVSSKNSGKDIANNLFLYFDKKQNKMNNGTNKLTIQQNNQNQQQRFTIYAPILEGLTSCKREAISSQESQHRTNYIQKNKKFIVKNRPNTTNPTNRQLNQHHQICINEQQGNRINSKYYFQEFPNIEKGNKTKIFSANAKKSNQTGEIDNSFPQHHFISEGYVSNQKDLPQIESNSENIQGKMYKQYKQIMKIQTSNNQCLNSSFDMIQNSKNSQNKKYQYCNNNLNISTLTQGMLSTQADTTLQINYETTIGQKHMQVQTLPTKLMNSKFNNNRATQKELSQEQTIQTLNKTVPSNFQTEENEVEYFKTNTNDSINNTFANNNYIHQQNKHFSSQSTYDQNSTSTQQIEFMQTYKNTEGTTIDTQQNINFNQLNDIPQQLDKGVERVSAILNQQNLNEHQVDQSVINASYRNLLNERPPYQKLKQNKIKIRSQNCLTEGNQPQKDASKKSFKNTRNNSFQEINRQEINIIVSNKNILNYSPLQTQLNKSQQKVQFNPQIQIPKQNKIFQEQFTEQKLDLPKFNKNNSDSLSNQTLVQDQKNYNFISNNREILQDDNVINLLEKNEDQELSIESIQEDIQETQRNQLEENNNIAEVKSQNNKDLTQDQKFSCLQDSNQQKQTPQKFQTNNNSLQNSLQKYQNIKSNHITFNATSNGKEYFQSNEQSGNQQNKQLLQNQQSSDQNYITSSFDGKPANQSLVEQQIDQEIRVSKYINEMQEYIQNQIDNSKITINQYTQTNQHQSTKSIAKQDSINQTLQIQNSNNQQINSCQQENQLVTNKPIIPPRPLTGIKKVNIEKKYNFYDELEKKLNEKKKNITNFIETNIIQVESAQQTNNSFINKDFTIRPRSQQASNRSYVNGRYNQFQLNTQQPIQNELFSLRKINWQDQSNELRNLQLNEQKQINFRIPENRKNTKQFNGLDISNNENNMNKITDVSLNSNCIQQINLEQSQQIRLQTQQIYYDQILETHITKEINNNHTNLQPLLNDIKVRNLDTKGNPHFSFKCSRRPSSQQNNYRCSEIQYQDQTHITENSEYYNQTLPYQQHDSEEYSNLSNSRAQKQRSSTMDNFFKNQNNNENIYPQINAHDRSSILNSSRNECMTSSNHTQLTREQQLEIFKQIKEQSQNKHKLHNYLQQNQSLHEFMKQKQLSSTICKNNSMISQRVQNQIDQTLQNFSSNNLGYVCNTEQTSQLNLNTQFYSPQKKSFNQLSSLSNTQDFLQYTNLVDYYQPNNSNDKHNQYMIHKKQQDNPKFQSNQYSSRQNPLIQSDQSQFSCINNTDLQFSQNNISNQFDLKNQIKEKKFNNMSIIHSNHNLQSIPFTNEDENAFTKRKQSKNELQNIQTQQQMNFNSFNDQEPNNLQFYDNLNNTNYDDTKENLAIDQKIYANHQYKYAIKKQHRREEYQILKDIDNIFNSSYNITNDVQLKQNSQKQQKQNQVLDGQKQFHNLNSYCQDQNLQNQKEQLPKYEFNIQINNQKENNQQRNVRNQFDSKKNKENQSVQLNDFNLSSSFIELIDDNNSQIRQRQTNSKQSHRYNIKLNDEVDDKTLEYSGSKAGVDNYQ